MIYRFTNSRGRHHYGVAVEQVGNGAYVLGDEWSPKDGVTVPASFGYISFEPNPFVVAEVKHELLPLDTKVSWRLAEIAAIVRMMQIGTFAQWWAEHRPEIVQKFCGYRKV